MDSVFISPSERSKATSALAAIASNFLEHPKVTPDLRARALGIALRLDGVHSESVDALEKLTAGEPTQAVEGFTEPSDAAEALWEVGEAMDVPDATADDQLLACFLMDIAARIDPDRPGGFERYKELALKGDFRGWGGIVVGSGASTSGGDDNPLDAPPIDVPAGPAVPLKNEEGSYRALALDTSSVPARGRIADLAATSVVGTLETAMTLRFADDQGVDVAGLEPTSAFVPVAMRATGTGWPANGGSITVAIEGGQAPATGQAMALPAALLVRSMIADSELVEGVASVGGVGEGGEITAVPNLLAYFRGLDSTDAPMVLVPEANLPQLMDLAAMGSFEPLLTHQIFTAADLDGAAAIAIEQSDDTKRARLSFGDVQDLAASMPATDLVTNKAVRERLEAIIKLAPSHASAKILLAAGAPGGTPGQLSRGGAVYALEQAASPVAKLMSEGGDPAVANVAVFGGAKSILTGVRPKLDKEAVTVADDLRTMIEKIEAYSRMNNRDSEQGTAMKESITTQWGGLRSAYNALRSQGGG